MLTSGLSRVCWLPGALGNDSTALHDCVASAARVREMQAPRRTMASCRDGP